MGRYGKNQAHNVRTLLGKPSSREESWAGSRSVVGAASAPRTPMPQSPLSLLPFQKKLNFFPIKLIPFFLDFSLVVRFGVLSLSVLKVSGHERVEAHSTLECSERKALHDCPFLMCGLVREKSVCVQKTTVLCWMTPANGTQSACNPVV